jgi:hypothetical protein
MERLWFKSAGASLVLSVTLILADATRGTGNSHYSFGVNLLAVGSYATAAIGLISLVCGLVNIRLARSRFVLGEDALRRIREIIAEPGYTWAEKHSLLKRYFKMRMRITGTVDITGWDGISSQVPVLTPVGDFIAFMTFKGIFVRYLAVLPPEARVTVVGKIKRIEPCGIYLVNCEIVPASRLGYGAI